MIVLDENSTVLLPVPKADLLPTASSKIVPAFFAEAGENAAERYLEFFVATIRNPNTRRAYSHAAMRFANWCDDLHLTMTTLRPSQVSAYVEQMSRDPNFSAPTVKQHLSAIHMLFNWLVIGQI